MKKIFNWIKKELVIKLDFVNNEFELGWIWVVYFLICSYPAIRNLIVFLF